MPGGSQTARTRTTRPGALWSRNNECRAGSPCLTVRRGQAAVLPDEGQGAQQALEAAARGRGELVDVVVAIAAGPAHVCQSRCSSRRRMRLRPSSGSPRRRRTPPSPRLPCVTTCLPVFVAWRLCPVSRLCRVPCPRVHFNSDCSVSFLSTSLTRAPRPVEPGPGGRPDQVSIHRSLCSFIHEATPGNRGL